VRSYASTRRSQSVSAGLAVLAIVLVCGLVAGGSATAAIPGNFVRAKGFPDGTEPLETLGYIRLWK
jgi:hypothetical protein